MKCQIGKYLTVFQPRPIQFQLNLNTNTEHVNSLIVHFFCIYFCALIIKKTNVKKIQVLEWRNIG